MRRRSASRPLAGCVSFSDFEWIDPRTGVSVTVHGEEVQSIFKAIAECNDVPAATLLQNSQFKAGQLLECHQAEVLPRGWSWQLDSAGYPLVKLKTSFVPRAHSFLRDAGDDDSDYELPREHKRPRRLPASFQGPCTPQRARRAHRPRVGSEEAYTPPQEADVGCNQPVQIRLHRAAYLASCADPEAASGLQVRHICGNKTCAVVSHYRLGDATDNRDDENYHKSSYGRSRERHNAVQ